MLRKSALKPLYKYASHYMIYRDLYRLATADKESKNPERVEHINKVLAESLKKDSAFKGNEFNIELLRSDRIDNLPKNRALRQIKALKILILKFDKNFIEEVECQLQAKKILEATDQLNYYLDAIKAREKQLKQYQEIIQICLDEAKFNPEERQKDNGNTLKLHKALRTANYEIYSEPFGISEAKINEELNTNLKKALEPLINDFNERISNEPTLPEISLAIKHISSEPKEENLIKYTKIIPLNITPPSSQWNQGHGMGAIAGLGTSVGIAAVHLSTGGAPLIVYIGYAVGTIAFTVFSSWLGGRAGRTTSSFNKNQDNAKNPTDSSTQTGDINILDLETSHSRFMRPLAKESKRSTSPSGSESNPTTPTQLSRSVPSTAVKHRPPAQQSASEPRRRGKKGM